MDQTGEIHSIGQTQTVGQKGFRKRAIVLRLTGDDQKPEWPKYCEFEFIKDSCDKLDVFRVGMDVTIQWSLDGRIWEGNGKGPKCFNTLRAWRIETTGEQSTPQQSSPQQASTIPPTQGAPDPPNFDDNFDIEGDDIPF